MTVTVERFFHECVVTGSRSLQDSVDVERAHPRVRQCAEAGDDVGRQRKHGLAHVKA